MSDLSQIFRPIVHFIYFRSLSFHVRVYPGMDSGMCIGFTVLDGIKQSTHTFVPPVLSCLPAKARVEIDVASESEVKASLLSDGHACIP